MTILDGSLANAGNILASASAIGTAAYGLVDATKVYRGGISNIGFGFIEKAIGPYRVALDMVNASDPFGTIRANWLNGVAKADQKATIKSLVRLGITATTIKALSEAAPGVDAVAFAAAATKLDEGAALTEQDINVFGRFDAILDAQMDAAYERADQQYRNSAKVLAAGFAVVLSLCGMWVINSGKPSGVDWSIGLLLGLISTPLAPIAKDLSSAIGTAATAYKAVKG